MGHRRRQRRLDLLNAIPRKKKSLKAGEEGEVPEGGNGVIRKIDSILILLRNKHEHEHQQDQKQDKQKREQTFAIPKFSIAGILCPTRLEHTKRYQSSSFQKCSICPFQALCMYIERTSEIQLAIFDRVDV